MNPTRRALAFLFPALAAARPQTPAASLPASLPSKAFAFSEMSGRQSGPIKVFQILTGNTHTGYRLDLHESELPGGGVPHPPHQHVHEELLFLREGEMEVLIGGQWTRLGPGSCAYMASNDLHGYRNPGTVPAKYFVLALGSD
jgi:mannose-6-phosphate isomerase-like protein (cupin superfamily)